MGVTRRSLGLVTTGIVVAVVVGLVVLGERAPAPSQPQADTAPSVPTEAETPTDRSISEPALDPIARATSDLATGSVLDEVTVAQSADRTEAGARSAAVAILELTEEAVLMSPADAATFQRPFSTVGFADEAAARTEEQMVELRQTIPDGITLRLAPIAVHSAPTGEDWLVSIWFVEAITIGNEAVVDDWRTATYTMRWEDNAWKVAAFDSVRGPMPGRGTQPASAPPLQFEALLAGFDDTGLN